MACVVCVSCLVISGASSALEEVIRLNMLDTSVLSGMDVLSFDAEFDTALPTPTPVFVPVLSLLLVLDFKVVLSSLLLVVLEKMDSLERCLTTGVAESALSVFVFVFVPSALLLLAGMLGDWAVDGLRMLLLSSEAGSSNLLLVLAPILASVEGLLP